MSIKKSFNGKTIRKPGAYSKASTDNTAGAPSISTDVLMLVGESSIGAPGSVTGVVEFAVERLSDLIATFGVGPLVDCALAAARPSKQNGVGGASTIMVYKTNAAQQAAAILKKSGSNMITVKDSAWGAPGNDLSIVVAAGDSGNQKQLSVAKVGDTTEVLGENQAQSVLSIHYVGNGTAATMTIAGSTQLNKTLVTALTGQSDSSVNLNIALKNYTMKTLVDYINNQPGYTASLNTVSLAQNPSTELDPQTAQSIMSAQIQYRLQHELVDLLNTSKRVQATIQDVSLVGLPDNATTFLTGGVKGASANSDFSNGFAASFAEDYSVLLACVSRDASEDIADAKQGFTDPSSAYTIASVLAAQDTHLRLRSDTKNRKEALGMGGIRKSTKAAAFAAIAAVGSEYMQVALQDALVLDSTGTLRYMHPHVVAALAAGMRTGQAVGEPLTHKFPNVLDVGHFINPDTGLSAGDFNPGLDYDAGIDAGALMLEKASGGFRWMVDNTTYGIDNSFIFNRGSVMAAANYVNRIIRETAEGAFVGKKVSNGAASSIKSVVRNKLRELNAPDVNIITSSSDAPEGFREDTFVVVVNGNTATVTVEYKPVQGLDFIFFEFTLGDIKQSA
jgi:hypothetical protein